MPDPQWHGLVRDAWDSIRAKVATDIPLAVKDKPLSNESYTAKLGVCSALNSSFSRSSAIWADDGEGTLNLTSVTVSDFNGVTAGNSEISGLQVKLPLPFAVLQASARYDYTQPCAQYSLGKKGLTTTTRGAGTMNAKSETGTLRFVIQVIDPDGDIKLQLTGATVDGKRSTNVTPDGTPDNAFLRLLFDIFARGFQERRSIEAALESFFGNGQFGRDMVAELNKIINLQLARKGSRS